MILKTILRNPPRLFLCVLLITLYGVYCGLTLPVSMYPATSRPTVNMWVPYGTYSMESFRSTFGNSIESQIQKISNSEIKIDEVLANYRQDNVVFKVKFDWGTPFDKAKKEIEQVASSVSGILPKEIADSIGVWQRNRNAGFFAASIYSDEMSLRDLYFKVNPILQPELTKISDAEQASIWNPERYIISIKLIPEKMAQYGLYPRDIKRQIESSFTSYSGSKVKLGRDYQKFEIAASINNVQELSRVLILKNEIEVYLKDIAKIDYGRDLHREQSFKTNGLSSLILFAKPKSGANVKKMSEDIMKVLESKKGVLPKSLKFKKIVDPAETINKSVNNLFKDVLIASLMAVLVLFLFIGGIKNVGTAFIEIPLSMILSFIFMKSIGMNINLISLGGLALAAGMNVDASVVILENIFKHRQIWHKKGKECTRFSQRVELVYQAVREVFFPVILSITTTLIVFIPMAFTSNLTNAILGDLAKAVIFSHAISGFVALIIVPSVRVLLLKKYNSETKAPFEKGIQFVEKYHEKILVKLLNFKFSRQTMVVTPFILVAILAATILPNLPKEVIGKPGSDWVYMYISAFNTKSGRHMENILQESEQKALKILDGLVDYTWLEKYDQNGGQVMFKLFDRTKMEDAKKALKEEFKNSSKQSYWISDWNPAELPLPEEWHFKAVITGNEEDVFNTSSKLNVYLNELAKFDRVQSTSNSGQNFSFVFKPYYSIWTKLQNSGETISLAAIADISQFTKQPIKVGQLDLNQNTTDVKLSIIDERYLDPTLLESYPVRVNNKIIPLKALGKFQSERSPGKVLVRNGQIQNEVFAAVKEEDKKGWEKINKQVEININENLDQLLVGNAKIELKYPQEELKDSLDQLAKSLLFSLLLIFFVLWMQFQSIKQVSVIMMTIPLGIIGVLCSLQIFDSFLSLNSALGIILLNGITVNNSILLTDVTNNLRAKGLRGQDLIISASKKRLRPIIITSLTTILGMFPVALGMGDGGKILQPLGIAVTGGLFMATIMTIFIVPVLLYKKEKNINILEEIGSPVITNNKAQKSPEMTL